MVAEPEKVAKGIQREAAERGAGISGLRRARATGTRQDCRPPITNGYGFIIVLPRIWLTKN